MRHSAVARGRVASSLARRLPALRAQTYVGPDQVHRLPRPRPPGAKWQKEEPAAHKDKAHFDTRKQLDEPKAAAYAKAIGLADPYDVKGSCVTCHATVFRGDANAGVSCESCHGPAQRLPRRPTRRRASTPSR